MDALHRATIGIDTNDAEMFNSAWINREDAVFEINGNATKGLDEIHKNMFAGVGPLTTMHYTTNIRLDHKEGANTASITANAMNQHFRPGESLPGNGRGFLAGSWYWLDMVKDSSSGVWKIKKWAMKVVWGEGDMSIVMP